MKERVTKRYHRVFFVGLLMLNQLSAMERPRFDVDTIREQLPSYTKVAEGALGRDITVFIGNTGVGKSTLIDTAVGYALRIDSKGKIVLKDEESDAAPIGPGVTSITQYPQRFHSPTLGDMYDLPGFLDTKGTVGNILNASAIHAVLTNARTVRVIFVTSSSELNDVARGYLSKEFDKAVSMFTDSFLHSPSCAVIVNGVEREIVGNPEDIMSSLSGLGNISKIRNRVLLKRARVGDNDSFLEELKETLLHGVQSVQPGKVGQLNMARTFDPKASTQIVEFFKDCMKRYMETTNEERYKKAVEEFARTKAPDSLLSKILHEKQGTMWNLFQKDMALTPEYKLLHEVCGLQYSKALEVFEAPFYHEHLSIVRITQVKEKQAEMEAAEKAQKEAESKAEQSAQEAQAAKEQAALRAQEKEKAEKLEQIAKAQAEAALADASKSKGEKEQALQEAQRASEQLIQARRNFESSLMELQERTRKAEEEQIKYREAAHEAKKRTEDLLGILKKKEEEREKELKDMQKDMEIASRRNERDLEELRRRGDESAKKYEQEMERMRESSRRDMEDMQRRHQAEIAAVSRRDSDGGLLGIIKTLTSFASPIIDKLL